MRLAKLGARFLVESALADFKDGKATIANLLDGSETVIEIDDIVTALTNVSNNSIARELEAKGVKATNVGDCIAARHAAAALYDGGAPAGGVMLWLDAEAVRHFGDFRRLVPAIQEMNRQGTDQVGACCSASHPPVAGRTTG